jgi:recombination protein RecT
MAGDNKGMTALALLDLRKAEFLKVIPKHLNGERMVRIAEGSIRRTPKLMECTAASLLRSVMEASQLGLEPGVLGDGWLIPYSNSYKDGDQWVTVAEAQFQPGYQGLEKIALRSGSVKAIHAKAVYPGDAFDYDEGDSPFIKHKRVLKRESNLETDLIAVYCVVELMTGGKQFQILSKDEVEKVKNVSKSKNSKKSPWNEWYEAMAIKTAIKRALKHVPKAPDLARAVEYDDRRDLDLPTKDLFGPDAPSDKQLPEALPGEGGEPTPQDVMDEAAQKLGVKPAKDPFDPKSLDEEAEGEGNR